MQVIHHKSKVCTPTCIQLVALRASFLRNREELSRLSFPGPFFFYGCTPSCVPPAELRASFQCLRACSRLFLCLFFPLPSRRWPGLTRPLQGSLPSDPASGTCMYELMMLCMWFGPLRWGLIKCLYMSSCTCRSTRVIVRTSHHACLYAHQACLYVYAHHDCMHIHMHTWIERRR